MVVSSLSPADRRTKVDPREAKEPAGGRCGHVSCIFVFFLILSLSSPLSVSANIRVAQLIDAVISGERLRFACYHSIG